MREVQRSATVQQPPARIYELINDVEAYPQFVPGITYARVESRSKDDIVATLRVRRGPLQTEFTTRNELEPDRRIFMRLLRGPFKMLEGEWTLTPVGRGGCRIDLSIRFAFANRLSAVLFEPLFQDTAASLIDAFVARAMAV
ncbi:MAG: type II toxin-antitoxin system RatA family toxin [Steroidobacteraceae bacterium]